MLTSILMLPSWAKTAIVAAVILGAVHARHWWVERGLRAEIATVTVDRDQQRAAVAEMKIAIADVSANRDRLASTVRSQNEAIAVLEQRAKAAETAAALRAVRVVSRGREEADALRAPKSTVRPGNDAMNAWFQQQFGGSQ